MAQLFSGKVSATALDVVKELAGARWSRSGDLAGRGGVPRDRRRGDLGRRRQQLGALEDELFRFERTVDGNQDLRAAFSDQRGDGVPKADLVEQLLRGKATEADDPAGPPGGPGTAGTPDRRRARSSTCPPRAARREQSVAHATVAAPLSAAHHTGCRPRSRSCSAGRSS